MKKTFVLMVLPFLLVSLAAASEKEGLVEKEKRGWLGVYPETLSEAMRIALDIDHGVLVNDVVAGTPAETAGFQKGDVILELDGEKPGNASDLRQAIRERPNKQVGVLVRRRGKPKRLSVKLGEREAPELLLTKELSELPAAALKQATEALRLAGPELEKQVKLKVISEELDLEELREELDDLREELEELREQIVKESSKE